MFMASPNILREDSADSFLESPLPVPFSLRRGTNSNLERKRADFWDWKRAGSQYNKFCASASNYYLNWRNEENLPMDFCKNSSLHGLKYIGERKQHFVERMFWTIAFTIGLVVACFMISDVWDRYKSNSVIITFAPYETKIEEIPFPAVTICNMNKILKSKAHKIVADSKGFSGLDKKSSALENLYYLNHVCSTSSSFSRVFNYSANRGKIDREILKRANRNEKSYDGGKEDLWNFFLEASPLCKDMILKCIWEKEVRNCSELFTPIETDNGKCCTFNMLPSSILHRFNVSGMKEDPVVTDSWEWDWEFLVKSRRKGVPTYPKYPRRQKIPGQSFGLSILLDPGLEEYFCTSSDSHGFRITAHPPIDVPHISDFGLAIKPNSEVFINVRPEVTIADKATIGRFPAERRECYFTGEKELSFYNFYTAKNCYDECLANLTYQECNCRRHYQPGEDSKPLCGPRQFHCASNIKRKFVGTFKTKCKMCIPTCNEIAYHTAISYTPLQSPTDLWMDSEGNFAEFAEKNVSIVHIFFGEDSTNAKLRKELYGTIDLVANFGGLMGLCLGFSGLSLIEVIYFLTLRAWCRIRRAKKKTQKFKKEMQRSLTRTETTTELIDYAEEAEVEETGRGDEEASYLEMKPVMASPGDQPLFQLDSSVSLISKLHQGLLNGNMGKFPGKLGVGLALQKENEINGTTVEAILRAIVTEAQKQNQGQQNRNEVINANGCRREKKESEVILTPRNSCRENNPNFRLT